MSNSAKISCGGAPRSASSCGRMVFPRDRRDLAVELGQLLGPHRREQVGAAREHLAELDEGRPQRLDRPAQALGLRQAGDVDLRLAPREDRDVAQPETVDDLVDAEADQDRGDLRQPLTVARSNEGGFQHKADRSVRATMARRPDSTSIGSFLGSEALRRRDRARARHRGRKAIRVMSSRRTSAPR